LIALVRFYSDILGKEIRVDNFMGAKTWVSFPLKGMNRVSGDLVTPRGRNKPCSNETQVYLSCEGIIDEVNWKSRKIWRKDHCTRIQVG
jgi:predicted enzyme related to lactoylglutathione lyase